VRVGDLERHAHPNGCRMADLDLVDHALLGRVGDLQGGPAGVEDGNAGLTLALERGPLGESEDVSVESDRLVVVIGLDDEAELEDGSLGCCGLTHRRSRYGRHSGSGRHDSVDGRPDGPAGHALLGTS
jgi:hypothetical protein